MVIGKGKLKFRTQRFRHLTDSQWQVIKEFLNVKRKRKHDLRTVVNGILRIARTGEQWRNLPTIYPPWESVYYYFKKWQKDFTWNKILSHLVVLERVRQGRNPYASRAAVDSQSVKISSFISINTGLDGNKKINGRKRHIAVDVLGLPLALHVSAANEHDGKAGIELLWQIEKASKNIELIRADNAYKGYFTKCAAFYNWKVETDQRPPSKKGFIPQPARWQVERTFGWFKFFRRLSQDFEKTTESAVTFMQLAFISIILARI